jgi:hypothetical protein
MGVKEFVHVIHNHVDLHESFDFLGFDDVYFENYIDNELLRWFVFKTSTSFASVLYRIYKLSPSART